MKKGGGLKITLEADPISHTGDYNVENTHAFFTDNSAVKC